MAVDKLVDSTQLDANLTSVADAIRTKGGTSGQLAFPAGFVSAIEAISGGGGEDPLTDFLNNAWPSGDVVITGASKIRGGAFAKNTSITSVSSDSITQIGENGGSDPLLNVGAFLNCTNLTSVSFPNLTYLGFNAFQGCSKLTSVSLPALTTMGISGSRSSYTFANCLRLQLLHLPELTYVNGVYSMGSLGSASYPITIVLPKLAGVAPSFRGSNCAAVDLGPNVTSIPSSSIYNTTTMPILILRRTDGVVTPANADAILGVTSTTAVYVPADLIDSYKAATHWSAKGDVFHAIEGSVYENAYADGTPIS